MVLATESTTRELARIATEMRALADRLSRITEPMPSRMDYLPKSRPTTSTTSLRAKVHEYLVANPGWCTSTTIMASLDVRCSSALVCTALRRLHGKVERRANISGGGDRWEWRAIT